MATEGTVHTHSGRGLQKRFAKLTKRTHLLESLVKELEDRCRLLEDIAKTLIAQREGKTNA